MPAPYRLSFPEDYALKRIEISASGILTIYPNPIFNLEATLAFRTGTALSNMLQKCLPLGIMHYYENAKSNYGAIRQDEFLHSALELHAHDPKTIEEEHYHLFSGGLTTRQELQCFLQNLINYQNNETLRQSDLSARDAQFLLSASRYAIAISKPDLFKNCETLTPQNREWCVWTKSPEEISALFDTKVRFISPKAVNAVAKYTGADLETAQRSQALIKRDQCKTSFYCSNQAWIDPLFEMTNIATNAFMLSLILGLTATLVSTKARVAEKTILLSLELVTTLFTLYKGLSFATLLSGLFMLAQHCLPQTGKSIALLSLAVALASTATQEDSLQAFLLMTAATIGRKAGNGVVALGQSLWKTPVKEQDQILPKAALAQANTK